jgi:ribosome-associated translation inhibitor RaiA
MGLPQLNTETYVSQIFWLGVCFFVLYVYVRNIFIPRMEEILRQRDQRIHGDVEKAKNFKNSTEKMRADYQARLTQNQIKARQQHEDVLNGIEAFKREKEDKLQKVFVRKKQALEKEHFFDWAFETDFVKVLLSKEAAGNATNSSQILPSPKISKSVKRRSPRRVTE